MKPYNSDAAFYVTILVHVNVIQVAFLVLLIFGSVSFPASYKFPSRHLLD